jgi:hypothetical protein
MFYHLWREPPIICDALQEAAGTLFKHGKMGDAAAQYKKCERHCLWAIEKMSSNKHQAAEVQQQLSLCRLNRSLCLFKTNLYEESHKLCMQVLGDRVSLPPSLLTPTPPFLLFLLLFRCSKTAFPSNTRVARQAFGRGRACSICTLQLTKKRWSPICCYKR